MYIGDGLLRIELHALGDDHDARLGHREAFAVGLQVVADLRLRRDRHAFVDNGPPDAAVVVDHDVLHDYRLDHLGAVVDADARGEDRVLHAAAADDAPAADDRIERDAKAAASEFL